MMRFTFIVLATVLLAGCGGISTDYHKLDLANVSGTVRLDGEPLPNAHIMFQSQDGTFSTGKTDESGNYELMFDSNKAGVLTGDKLVRIRRKRSWSGFPARPLSETVVEEIEVDDQGNPISSDGDDSGSASSSGSELPDVYHINSHIRATVESGSQTIDFDLKSDGSTTGPMN
jgi:hypothetical protein